MWKKKKKKNKNKKKKKIKNKQNQLILIPKCSFYFNQVIGDLHLMFLFTNKEITSLWNFESAFHNLTPQKKKPDVIR